MIVYIKYTMLLFLFICNFIGAQNLKVTQVISIYDGDTFRVDLDCKTSIFCKNIPIRIQGIDTPEIKGKCLKEKSLAIEARNFTRAFLSKGTVTLHNIKRGKYFRIVADVYVNGKSLTQALIRNNLGLPYDGKKKSKVWCKD